MSTNNSPAARSIIYLCCIGGLLVVNSAIVMILWNNVLEDVMASDHDLSFLEGAGLTAFAYVVVFSVRYGIQGRALPGMRPTSSVRSQPTATPASPPSQADPSMQRMCSQLTPEERAQLKHELATKAGCRERSACDDVPTRMRQI